MKTPISIFIIVLVFTVGVLTKTAIMACASSTAPGINSAQLDKPGQKIPLGAGYYFVYGFEKKPKLGNAIVRVEIYSRDGRPDTSFVVKGSADMPSMRGAHSSGDREFVISKKGAYLLPVRLVMPGDWEVCLTFVKNGNVVLRGVHLFDI